MKFQREREAPQYFRELLPKYTLFFFLRVEFRLISVLFRPLRVKEKYNIFLFEN